MPVPIDCNAHERQRDADEEKRIAVHPGPFANFWYSTTAEITTPREHQHASPPNR